MASTLARSPENSIAARRALEEGRHALVWRRLIADTETPVGAALKLMVPERGDYLLESVEGGEVRGRYSLLGIDPDLVFRATDTASLREIYGEIDRAEKTEFEAPEFTEYREIYPYFLWPALLLFVLELVLAETALRKLP